MGAAIMVSVAFSTIERKFPTVNSRSISYLAIRFQIQLYELIPHILPFDISKPIFIFAHTSILAAKSFLH